MLCRFRKAAEGNEYVDVKQVSLFPTSSSPNSQSSIMLIFDILTESLFNVSLSDKNSIEGFDCNEFMSVEEITLREAVARV